MNKTVLLVEDDKKLRELVTDYFTAAGFNVLEAENGDDYVTKPFSPLELVARAKALIKRSGEISERSPEIWQTGPLRPNQKLHKRGLAPFVQFLVFIPIR